MCPRFELVQLGVRARLTCCQVLIKYFYMLSNMLDGLPCVPYHYGLLVGRIDSRACMKEKGPEDRSPSPFRYPVAVWLYGLMIPQKEGRTPSGMQSQPMQGMCASVIT